MLVCYVRTCKNYGQQAFHFFYLIFLLNLKMGSNASKLAKKFAVPFRSNSTEDIKDNLNSTAVKNSSCPLVFSRRGSMYKDEDGDLAHEFYIEVPPTQQGSKATMKRVYDNLTPQGEVYYSNARLHSDFPYIVANI